MEIWAHMEKKKKKKVIGLDPLATQNYSGGTTEPIHSSQRVSRTVCDINKFDDFDKSLAKKENNFYFAIGFALASHHLIASSHPNTLRITTGSHQLSVAS